MFIWWLMQCWCSVSFVLDSMHSNRRARSRHVAPCVTDSITPAQKMLLPSHRRWEQPCLLCTYGVLQPSPTTAMQKSITPAQKRFCPVTEAGSSLACCCINTYEVLQVDNSHAEQHDISRGPLLQCHTRWEQPCLLLHQRPRDLAARQQPCKTAPHQHRTTSAVSQRLGTALHVAASTPRRFCNLTTAMQNSITSAKSCNTKLRLHFLRGVRSLNHGLTKSESARMLSMQTFSAALSGVVAHAVSSFARLAYCCSTAAV